MKHRLEIPGEADLELIESQTCRYLDENYIVRFEDSYGIASSGNTTNL